MKNKEEKAKEYSENIMRLDYIGEVAVEQAYKKGWDEALKSQWVMVEERLPNVGTRVLVLTSKGKILVTFRYILKDTYGNILGEAEWQGSRALGKSIIAWMPIPSFDEILEANKDVLERLKNK